MNPEEYGCTPEQCACTPTRHCCANAVYPVGQYAPEPQPADPTPEPTDPQPVTDAYRCGDLTDDEWEVQDNEGGWWRPSAFYPGDVRIARRKQAPPLTPREGDIVKGPGAEPWPVAYVAHGLAIVDTGETLFAYALSDLTVTDRPPKRPVRVWLTDEQVKGLTSSGLRAPTVFPLHAALIDACRALVDEG